MHEEVFVGAGIALTALMLCGGLAGSAMNAQPESNFVEHSKPEYSESEAEARNWAETFG